MVDRENSRVGRHDDSRPVLATGACTKCIYATARCVVGVATKELLMIFDVYDQRMPLPIPRTNPQLFEANLPLVGDVEADSAMQAIKEATRLRLSRFPLVEART